MGIVYLIIIGAVAGFLAKRLMDVDLGLLPTMALGVAGALIGGVLLRVAMAALGLFGWLIGAVLGAMILLWLYQEVFEKRR